MSLRGTDDREDRNKNKQRSSIHIHAEQFTPNWSISEMNSA